MRWRLFVHLFHFEVCCCLSFVRFEYERQRQKHKVHGIFSAMKRNNNKKSCMHWTSITFEYCSFTKHRFKLTITYILHCLHKFWVTFWLVFYAFQIVGFIDFCENLTFKRAKIYVIKSYMHWLLMCSLMLWNISF